MPSKRIYASIQHPLINMVSKDSRVTAIHRKLPTEQQADDCDVIVVNSNYLHLHKGTERFKHIKKPKIAFIEDLHLPSETGKAKNRASHLIHRDFDCLFVRYKREFEVSRWSKTWDRPWFWMPHYIDPDLFKDWKLKKDIDTLSIGRYQKKSKYFIRHHFYHTFKDDEGFYRLELSEGKFGEDYSKLINSAKITGTSNKSSRAFAKSVEIPGSMSLMACNPGYELPWMGFEPDVHYIDVNEHNMREKVDYYLKSDEERMKMTLNGYELVHERHTVKVRVKQWFENVEKFMKGQNGR